MKKLAGIAVVVLLFAGLTALLMPSLHSARSLALRKSLEQDRYESDVQRTVMAGMAGEDIPAPVDARVHVFEAEVDLHPKLSVGTKQPEPIYQAACRARITATSSERDGRRSTVRLPLPPELISLADVNLTVNGEPDEAIRWSGRHLLWEGVLDPDTPAEIDISYTAVGKGVFQIEPPFGESVIDTFTTNLTAHQSDVRMLELSLQPQTYEKLDGKVLCRWNYERLLVGRPIRLDVLGIAPLDRLGELVWLGPVSVLVFGLLMATTGLATAPQKMDTWMLLLVVGAFAGGYPLMYFAQDFLPLSWAVFASAAMVLVIIAGRSLTLLGRAGVAVVAMAAGTQAIAISSAIYKDLQGVLLTGLGIVALAVTMSLLPRAQRKLRQLDQPPAPPRMDERHDSSEPTESPDA